MTDAVVALNVGSSSIKFALFDACPGGVRIGGGVVDRVGDQPCIALDGAGRKPVPDEAGDDHASLTGWLVGAINNLFPGCSPVAGGHRVVHGGLDYVAPTEATETVMAQLAALSPLAPDHQPHNLAGILALRSAMPGSPQIACFDTAFHRTQPRLAQLFALPRWLTDDGVLRYGFHGLSYDHVAAVLPDLIGEAGHGRVIAAHLGHGASLCAMKGGRSVATTMGFTALDGLMMGARCGAVDPGVLLHLQRRYGMDVDAVEALLAQKSGLLGVSGESGDMRDLLASPSPAAREAIDLFVYRAAREIGSLAAALGGLDALVFTGGIGERSPEIRAAICAQCAWLGVTVDMAANAGGSPAISPPGAAVMVVAVMADEEAVIARAVQDHLAGGRTACARVAQ